MSTFRTSDAARVRDGAGRGCAQVRLMWRPALAAGWRYALLTCLLMLGPAVASAQSAVSASEFVSASALAASPEAPHIAVFHDAQGTLTRAGAQAAAAAGRFRTLSGRRFHPGYGNGAWWLRLRFPSSVADAERWLHLQFHDVEQVQVWLPQTQGGALAWRRLNVTKGRPLPAKASTLGRGLALPLHTAPAGPVTVWLRLASPRPPVLETAQLLDRAGLVTARTTATAALTAALTIVVLMLLVAAIMAGVLRESMYAAFALQLAAMLVFGLGDSYPFLAWFSQGHPVLAVVWVNAGDALLAVTTVFMGYALLDLRRTLPRLARLLRGLMVLGVVVGVVGVASGASRPLSQCLFGEALLVNGLFIALAAWGLWRRQPLALWPFVAYLVGGSGAIADVIEKLDWAGLGGSGRVLLAVAPVVFAVAVAIMLAVHARRRARTAARVLRQAAHEARDSATRLESLVGERTAALHEALNDQRNLLNIVSHEFRTPLAVIDSSAQFIQAVSDGRDDVRELHKIRKATQRMVQLVDDLLADDQLHAVADRQPFETLQLADLVRELCKRNGELVGRDYRFTGDKMDSSVSVDARLLRIVVWNLLDNAAKYSPAGTSIDVFVGHDEVWVMLRVRDHGAGIRAADLPHIFERYWRSPSASRRSGLGLGLHVAQRIAGRHGGSLTAANAEGGGAVFELWLPFIGENKTPADS